jgi:excisionase family DNA binding protein
MDRDARHELDDLRRRLDGLAEALADASTMLGEALGRLDAPPAAPALLPVAEVSRRLGLGASTVYELIQSGGLPSRRVGRRVLVPEDAVEAVQRGAQAAPADGPDRLLPRRLAPGPTTRPLLGPHRPNRSMARPVPPRLRHGD